MQNIETNEILIKHLIKFNYEDKDKALFYREPHHIFKIEDSIHYKSLEKKEFETYKKLIETTKQEEHSENDFKQLIDEFDFEKLKEEKNKIKIFWDKELKKFLIEDGTHRMAIIKHKKLDKKGKLPLEIFKIRI